MAIASVFLALFGGRIGDALLAPFDDSTLEVTVAIENPTVASTVDDPILARTVEHLFTPAGPSFNFGLDKTVWGRCYAASSQNPGNPQARRCISDGVPYDPCFDTELTPQLLCIDLPWPSDRGLVMTAFQPEGDPLPLDPPPKGSYYRTDFPWALVLENGLKCRLGPANVFWVAGNPATYACADDVEALRTQAIADLDGWIIGNIDTDEAVWEAAYLSTHASANKETSMVRISETWR